MIGNWGRFQTCRDDNTESDVGRSVFDLVRLFCYNRCAFSCSPASCFKPLGEAIGLGVLFWLAARKLLRPYTRSKSLMLNLSRSAARALMLAAQGIANPPTHAATKADLLACIRRMAILQIDTIHVVARSPYLVLWSRLGDYDLRWLDELLAEGAIFEYWSHMASFLPSEHYPLYRRTQLDGACRAWSGMGAWVEEHRADVEHVRTYMREHGATMSSDFERTDGQKGTWWNWKAEKVALEAMFITGDLMIARRKNFQRVYDLRERVRPEWNDADAPPLAEVYRQFALETARALGVVLPQWQADYFRLKQKDSVPLLPKLAAEGALVPVSVEGFKETGYVHPENMPLAQQAAAGELVPSHTTLLSPFDPIVWDRRRALDLWGFDYRIECYTPAPKRRYGYFTLPILWRGELIGRLDPKAHRKDRIFEVKALHLEPGLPITKQLVDDVRAAVQDCANWHGTPNVVVRASDLPGLF